MITDDPGTPGNRGWEVNLAFAGERFPTSSTLVSPGIDLNYGVGDNIQLTLQTAPLVLMRNGNELVAAPGGTEAAVKWRFYQKSKSHLYISMFPRVIFNLSQSSVRRGLADPGTRFQVPFQTAKDFGRWHGDMEFGPVAGTESAPQWLYGVVAGLDLGTSAMVMGELHGTSRINMTDVVLTVNAGLRKTLSKHFVFITSVGHDISSPEPGGLIAYLGIQLLY